MGRTDSLVRCSTTNMRRDTEDVHKTWRGRFDFHIRACFELQLHRMYSSKRASKKKANSEKEERKNIDQSDHTYVDGYTIRKRASQKFHHGSYE